jgi:hypothetical protein
VTTEPPADEPAVPTEQFNPERAAAEWLAQEIAAGRMAPEPTPEEVEEVVRIVGPALRRMGAKRREPAA